MALLQAPEDLTPLAEDTRNAGLDSLVELAYVKNRARGDYFQAVVIRAHSQGGLRSVPVRIETGEPGICNVRGSTV